MHGGLLVYYYLLRMYGQAVRTWSVLELGGEVRSNKGSLSHGSLSLFLSLCLSTSLVMCTGVREYVHSYLITSRYVVLRTYMVYLNKFRRTHC
jgi:hypothetical protein